MKIRDEAYRYYFYFMEERMAMFWKKYEGQKSNLTGDKILAGNKFTNVYRAQDRVSQFLIREVIYGYGAQGMNEIDMLLRILVFKIFNNIDTWVFLEEKLGVLCVGNFKTEVIVSLLDERIRNKPIFSAAYMMTGAHRKYAEYNSKHEKWLAMVNGEMIRGGALKKIAGAKSLEEVYDILIGCSFIGEFLAYQYAIDFNYSEVLNFDENDFVKAGIGAIRGIQKCFPGIDNGSYEKCIRYTQENMEKYKAKYGFLNFKDLFGRQPRLIDLQNCFCETDKYLRAKMPELRVGNVRIKQKYAGYKNDIDFFFPPKWGINQYVKQCTTGNSTALTLF